MKKQLVPLNRVAGYLEAQKLANQKGMRLASNVLHDDYLVPEDHSGPRLGPDYPAWAREIIAHPEQSGGFRNGADIVDSGTGWTVLGSYLTDPKFIDGDAFRENTGLFIDPEDVLYLKGRFLVIPASITVLWPFIQINSASGMMDGKTHIPLDQRAGNSQKERFLYRADGVSVRPIARTRNLYGIDQDDGGDYYDRRVVICHYDPDQTLEVVGESAEKR